MYRYLTDYGRFVPFSSIYIDTGNPVDVGGRWFIYWVLLLVYTTNETN